ncbi:LysM peptidoglycan-binding domain-containing protein [bacterium]|nr:LysM peptidoglycan-binding domain-containing protein [bacterium]
MRKGLFLAVVVIEVLIGSSLVIFKFKSKAESPNPPAIASQTVKQNPVREVVYEVKEGDSLWSISRKFGVSIEEIAKFNNIKIEKTLQIGEKLRIPQKEGSNTNAITTNGEQKVKSLAGTGVYEIKEGDSLWTIGKKFGVSPEEIARANGISLNKTLKIGEKLIIPKAGMKVAKEKTSVKVSSSPRTSSASREGGIIYQVRAGDSLWTIGKRFGVSPEKIASANGISLNKTLQIGDKLVIPSQGRKQVARSQSSTAKKTLTAKGTKTSSNKGNGAPGVVGTALAYQGTRYSYGGFSSRGFDCSGFVKYVYQKHGLNLPHNAAAQYRYGKPVSKSELQPGDLVFFRTGRSKRINHVGIYIGNGKFIHASSARGRVRIDSLNEGYYKSRYVGARRLK